MLNVIIKEARSIQYNLMRPLVYYNRKINFPNNELKGINLVKNDIKGSVFWFNKND